MDARRENCLGQDSRAGTLARCCGRHEVRLVWLPLEGILLGGSTQALREAKAIDADLQNAWFSRIRHYIQHSERKSLSLIKTGQARGAEGQTRL